MPNAAIPTFSYHEPGRMIDWLRLVFGFETKLLYEDETGQVAHAELTLGGPDAHAMIMLGAARQDAFGEAQKPPSPGSVVTSSAYLVMDDVEACHSRALAAGAEIVTPLREEPFGGMRFSCRDPEGQVWTVGAYDPWKPAEAGSDG